ncbi:Narbonolide/10-deoxymethynolide synthase PikA1, modules 1 and 2 [Streptomyces violaceorubidus]
MLCLEHREVPPTLHVDTRSPRVDWDRLPLVLPDSPRPWPAVAGKPALAAVNGQGMSGVNAHVVLGPGPEVRDRTPRARATAGRPGPAPSAGRRTRCRPSDGAGPAAHGN